VLTLPDYPKSCFLKSTNSVQVIDSWNFRHSYTMTSISRVSCS
jgi:hypothetical protein